MVNNKNNIMMTQSSVDIEGGSWCRRHCHTEPVIEASKERGIGKVPFFMGKAVGFAIFLGQLAG